MVSGSTHMVVIFSNEQDESSTAQYFQGEIQLYTSGTTATYFYGTNAAHAGVNQNLSDVAATYVYTKVVFTNNGQAGATCKLYGLGNLNDLDDETNLITTYVVASNMTADGTTLYPGCITGDASTHLVAVKVENM
jgi:hypothetical protein